jgi:exonuclease SbcC
MQVAISNFRCYKDPVTFTFPANQTILLKGKSGAGKTTIFQAIFWALYGRLKNISPWDSPGAKTNVTLSFYFSGRPIQVIRTRNPRRLVVRGWTDSSDGIIEDKEAQAAINQMMGPELVWLSSSYLGQKLLNAFIVAPNDGKTELLHSLTFSDENPEVFISKTECKYNEVKKEYEVRVSSLNQRVGAFNSLYGDVDWSLTTPVSDIQQYLSSLKDQLDVAHTQLGEYRERLKNKEHVSRQLQLLRGSLASNLTEADIKKNIEVLTEQLEKARTYSLLLEEAASLKKQYRDVEDYTLDDLALAREQEASYSSMLNEFRSLGLQYSEQSRDQAIKYYSELIQSQDQAKKAKENKDRLISQMSSANAELQAISSMILQLEKNIKAQESIPKAHYQEDKLEEPVMIDYESSISDLRKRQTDMSHRIMVLKQGLDVLTCPHCSGHLRYTKSKLSPATEPTDPTELATLQSQLLEINQEISKLLELEKKQQDALSKYRTTLALQQERLDHYQKSVTAEREREHLIVMLKSQLSEFRLKEAEKGETLASIQSQLLNVPNLTVLDQTQCEQTRQILLRLSALKIVSPPKRSSSSMLEDIKQKEINSKYKKVQQEVDSSGPQVGKSVSQLTSELLASQKELADRERLSILQNQLHQIAVPPDPTPTIGYLKDEIQQATVKLEKAIKRSMGLAEHSSLSKEHQDIQLLLQDVTALHVLLTLAKKKEAATLQAVVNTINQIMSEICPSIFDDDIYLHLNIAHEGKAKINFTASDKGGNVDSITQFSGGEADRASVAVTLALSSLSSCPFILLDESLGGLDSTTKDRVVTLLGQSTKPYNKSVILIMQEGVEGCFDHVISL